MIYTDFHAETSSYYVAAHLECVVLKTGQVNAESKLDFFFFCRTQPLFLFVYFYILIIVVGTEATAHGLRSEESFVDVCSFLPPL